MEAKSKPRITYAQFCAQRTAKQTAGTVAWLIERFIREMNGLDTGKPVRWLGHSQVYTLRTLQRSPIGAVKALELTKMHVIEHCKKRRESVCPATVMHDVGYLSGVLKYAGSAPDWEGCEEVSAAAVAAAMPFLLKHGYIGKSTPRTRTPTDAEITALLEYVSRRPKKDRKNVIHAMPDIIAFGLVSARRLGEICRITHADVHWDHLDDKGHQAPIYWVRDLKHPTKKKGNDKSFTLFPELAEIIKRQPRKEGDDRIFPFDAKSVGAKYTLAKNALGIEGLHFHDSRREAITNWLKKLTPHQVRKFISGHNTGAVFDRVYDATDPADGHSAMRKPEQERIAA